MHTQNLLYRIVSIVFGSHCNVGFCMGFIKTFSIQIHERKAHTQINNPCLFSQLRKRNACADKRASVVF